MRQRTVVISPEAKDDLLALYDRIAEAANADIAMAYIDRLEDYCMAFDLASERGTRREDVRPGLRITNFEKRVTVAFSVGEADVTILRLFSKGKDWEAALT